MSYFSIFAVVLGVAAVVAFFVLKRVVKWAVRVALLVVALSLIGAGGLTWWLSSRSDEQPKQPAPGDAGGRRKQAGR